MSASLLDVVRDMRNRVGDDIVALQDRGASPQMTVSAELNRLWDALEHLAAHVDAS